MSDFGNARRQLDPRERDVPLNCKADLKRRRSALGVAVAVVAALLIGKWVMAQEKGKRP